MPGSCILFMCMKGLFFASADDPWTLLALQAANTASHCDVDFHFWRSLVDSACEPLDKDRVQMADIGSNVKLTVVMVSRTLAFTNENVQPPNLLEPSPNQHSAAAIAYVFTSLRKAFHSFLWTVKRLFVLLS